MMDSSQRKRSRELARLGSLCSHTGKVGFTDRANARKFAKRNRQKHNKRYRIYLCPGCNLFHLTTQGK